MLTHLQILLPLSFSGDQIGESVVDVGEAINNVLDVDLGLDMDEPELIGDDPFIDEHYLVALRIAH
jgi:hypothetical protein